MGNLVLSELRQRWLILLLTLATFFLLLGSRPLNEPDEGRYSEVAREMVETGDWLIPHFWYLPHLDKPPMTYWCVAVSLKVFGENEWAVRLPLALAGLSGLWAAFLLARSVAGARIGWLSILLLQTSLLYFTMARMLTTDLLLTQSVAWSMYFLWRSWQEIRADKPQPLKFIAWQLSAGVAIAFGFLTKGPVALAIPLVSMLALIYFRRRQLNSAKVLLPGLFLGFLVSLLLVLPWFLAVFHRQSEAAEYMIIDQAFGHLYGITINNRRGSVFYFFGIITVGLLPWTVLLGWLWRRAHWRQLAEPSQDAWLFLNVWAIFTFTLFSLTHAKLPAYILPLFPALVILLAWRFFPREPAETIKSTTQWRLCLVSACFLPAVFPVLLKFAFHDPLAGWLIGQILIFIGLALTFFWGSKSWTGATQVTLTLTTAWLGMMIVAAELPRFDTTFRANQTLKPLGVALREHYQPGTPIVCWGRLPQGLPFYAHPAITPTHPPYFGNLDWLQVPFEYPGNRELRQSTLLLTDRPLVDLLRTPQRVLIVAFGNSLAAFQHRHPELPLHLITASGQWKLLENQTNP